MSDKLRLPKVKKTPKKPNKYTPKSKYSELEALPAGTNIGLTSPDNAFMLNVFGKPRIHNDYTQDDKGLDNPELEKLHKSLVDVGPFKVTGLILAIDSLRSVLKVISTEQPEVYERLGRDAMRCVRLQRDSYTAISNHSWGTAIDLKIDGLLDPWRDGKTQHGLALIVSIFNRHGWFWGGAYKPRLNKKTGKMKIKEDAMHFEVSKEKLLEWAQAGLLGPDAAKVARGIKVLRPGAKGPEVQKVQKALKKHVPSAPTHGSYDRMTERAVKEAQRIFSMTPTGIICKELLRRLKVAYDIYYEMY